MIHVYTVNRLSLKVYEINGCCLDTNIKYHISLLWRHNGPDGVSNHQHHDCLLNRLFGHRSKKTSKLRVTGLWAGNSPETGEFPAQMASNAENVSIWWRHHVMWYGRPTIGMQISWLRNICHCIFSAILLPFGYGKMSGYIFKIRCILELFLAIILVPFETPCRFFIVWFG